jgi:N-acetylneuraminate synthase
MQPYIKIGKRKIGADFPPLVIAEIGINHEGSFKKAKKMIEDAARVGAECVKFQSHVIEDEMVPAAKKVIPGNAKESIWDIMSRCALSEQEERELKLYAEKLGLIYLSTPFSRAAADRLHRFNVLAYKIGSGECNNYPLVEHIASFGRPIILSTGMNDINSIRGAVDILRRKRIPYAILHCVSLYPTPYKKLALGALEELRKNFPDAVIGLSDHSIGIYTCLGAVALGASILEKHFTSKKSWPGPDISISITPRELKELIVGSRAIYEALGGKKAVLKEEKPTINFAYASVVTISPVKKGEVFNEKNIWVKRPGTGEIRAKYYKEILGKKAACDIPVNTQLRWRDIAYGKNIKVSKNAKK